MEKQIFSEMEVISISRDRSSKVDFHGILIRRRTDLEIQWFGEEGCEYELWEARMPDGTTKGVERNFPDDSEIESEFTISEDFNDDFSKPFDPEKKKPVLKIIGTNGNVFSILGKAGTVARRNKMNWQLISDEARTGDYNHVLVTLMKYFEVE